MPWLSEQDSVLGRSPGDLQSTPEVSHWMDNNSNAARLWEGCIWLLLGQAKGWRQQNRKLWTFALSDHPCIWHFSFTPPFTSTCRTINPPDICLLLITFMVALHPTPMVWGLQNDCYHATIPCIVNLVPWGVNQYYHDAKYLKSFQQVCCGGSVRSGSDYSAQQHSH